MHFGYWEPADRGRGGTSPSSLYRPEVPLRGCAFGIAWGELGHLPAAFIRVKRDLAGRHRQAIQLNDKGPPLLFIDAGLFGYGLYLHTLPDEALRPSPLTSSSTVAHRASDCAVSFSVWLRSPLRAFDTFLFPRAPRCFNRAKHPFSISAPDEADEAFDHRRPDDVAQFIPNSALVERACNLRRGFPSLAKLLITQKASLMLHFSFRRSCNTA
jgi:hypothetical protein